MTHEYDEDDRYRHVARAANLVGDCKLPPKLPPEYRMTEQDRVEIQENADRLSRQVTELRIYASHLESQRDELVEALHKALKWWERSDDKLRVEPDNTSGAAVDFDAAQTLLYRIWREKGE